VLADRTLLRLSLAGLLLVVPQILGSVFLVELLHTGAGMSLVAASGPLALTQVLGATGRLGNGAWPDRVGSRLRPLRVLAVAIGVGFGGPPPPRHRPVPNRSACTERPSGARTDIRHGPTSHWWCHVALGVVCKVRWAPGHR
jgi:hypothetical protein